MVVIDATMLLLLLRPDVGVPIDSHTKQPIPDFHERLSYWIEQTEAAGTTILIPAPALSEVLVRAGPAGPAIVEKLREFSVFQIVPFDALEAIEVAAMTKAAIDGGDKRSGAAKDSTWAKVKYDRQIVATAKVAQATTIYSDDGDIHTLGKRANISVIRLSELPTKPLPPQQDLPFDQDAVDQAEAAEIKTAEGQLKRQDEAQDDTVKDEADAKEKPA